MDEAPPKNKKSTENTIRPPLDHPPPKISPFHAENVLGFSSNSGPSGLGVKLRYVGTLVPTGTTLHKVPIWDELKVPLQVSNTDPPPPFPPTNLQIPPTNRKVKNIMKNFIQPRSSPQKIKDSPKLKTKMKTTKTKIKAENTIDRFFQKTASKSSATLPPPSPRQKSLAIFEPHQPLPNKSPTSPLTLGQPDDVPDGEYLKHKNKPRIDDKVEFADELKNVKLKKIKLKENADMRKVDNIARGDEVLKNCNTRKLENFKDKINFFKNLQQKSSAPSHGETLLDGPSCNIAKESDSFKNLSEENGPMGDQIRRGPMRREDYSEVNCLK